MSPLFRPECPVRPVERDWIEDNLRWLHGQFGDGRLRAPVLTPTDEHFPGTYAGTAEDVEALVARLCAHMGVNPATIVVEHGSSDDDPRLSAYVPVHTAWSGAAGHHVVRDGRSVITIRDDLARRPMALVAVVAHELGHALLVSSADREDHEPLTDLLTVFFGLGIFGANAAFEYGREVRGEYAYTSTRRLGYLTEPMFGYALARYAWLRGEPSPPWARYLDTNPRTFLKRGLRYLAATAR